ncbi:Hint domain-containing protein [Plastorhodobacter daqingensis]|uniref:Hint domain-containing protein n=1 Tax=Plastorhodobacter daqingensis TaxID=1387281 RepID=A0ABW2UKP6_9RHOB
MTYSVSGVDSVVYFGSLLRVDGADQSIRMGNFGFPAYDRTLTEQGGNGIINVGESFALGSQTLTLVASGTLQTVNKTTFNVILATDSAGRQVIVFPSGDFTRLDGLLSSIRATIKLEPVGFNLGTNSPLCFVRGTRLLTPEGYRPVEQLAAGDVLVDRDGREVTILWVGRDTYALNAASREGLFPVEIAANAFGPGLPARAVRVSQQHRIMVKGPELALHFSLEEALAPAKALVNGTTVRLVRDVEVVDYYHVLCEEHAVLMAEGLETESMLLGNQARATLSPEDIDEIDALFPDAAEAFSMLDHAPAVPLLKTKEAQLLAALMNHKASISA